LTARGIETPGGAKLWGASQVRRVLNPVAKRWCDDCDACAFSTMLLDAILSRTAMTSRTATTSPTAIARE
jgi:hypothetical protein